MLKSYESQLRNKIKKQKILDALNENINDYGVKGMKWKNHKYVSGYQKKGRQSHSEEPEYEYEGKYSAESIPRISTADTEGGRNSIAANIDENGDWTPERKKLHAKIINNHFRNVKKPDGQPIQFFMGGGSGAGKGSYIKTMNPDLKSDNFVYVDPDEIKKQIPEYYFKNTDKEGNKIPKKRGASYTHEESSAITKAIIAEAQKNGYNVVWDGTGAGSVEKMKAKIKAAKDKGMKVKAAYVTVPIETALERVEARAQRTGRHVRPKVVKEIHKQVNRILPQIIDDFDEIELYDNSQKEGEKMTLIYSKKGKNKGKVANASMWNRFIEYGQK